MSVSSLTALNPSVRLTSLDQFRGYTMAGMLLVNFLGSYAICPRILKHTNDYCSYADTIMPQFLFAAGFAMRLSLGKRREAGGKTPWGRAIRRILGLALVAIIWYGFCDLKGIIDRFQKQPWDKVVVVLFKREFFQTLLHIAATSLWILPVIEASSKVRFGYAFVSGLVHVWISWWFNFDWIHTEPTAIDGGPLGLISWSIPALMGTFACDAVRTSGPKAAPRIVFNGVVVMFLGWAMSNGTTLYNVTREPVVSDGQKLEASSSLDSTLERLPIRSEVAVERGNSARKLSEDKYPPDPVIPIMERLGSWDRSIAEPPFVPPPDVRHRKLNYWMMSQRFGTISYVTFSAGLSLVIYAAFLWACDSMNWRLGFFRTLGTNSLVAYILHEVAIWVVEPFFPKVSTSVASTMAGFACFTFFVYAVCRLLERNGWYVRV